MWYEKNKVFIWGVLMAVLSVAVPYLQADQISWYGVAFASLITVISWATKNLKGQVITILGIIGATATNFFMAHPEPGGITIEYVAKSWLLPVLMQLITAFAGPSKPTEE